MINVLGEGKDGVVVLLLAKSRRWGVEEGGQRQPALKQLPSLQPKPDPVRLRGAPRAVSRAPSSPSQGKRRRGGGRTQAAGPGPGPRGLIGPGRAGGKRPGRTHRVGRLHHVLDGAAHAGQAEPHGGAHRRHGWRRPGRKRRRRKRRRRPRLRPPPGAALGQGSPRLGAVRGGRGRAWPGPG